MSFAIYTAAIPKGLLPVISQVVTEKNGLTFGAVYLYSIREQSTTLLATILNTGSTKGIKMTGLQFFTKITQIYYMLHFLRFSVIFVVISG